MGFAASLCPCVFIPLKELLNRARVIRSSIHSTFHFDTDKLLSRIRVIRSFIHYTFHFRHLSIPISHTSDDVRTESLRPSFSSAHFHRFYHYPLILRLSRLLSKTTLPPLFNLSSSSSYTLKIRRENPSHQVPSAATPFPSCTSVYIPLHTGRPCLTSSSLATRFTG